MKKEDLLNSFFYKKKILVTGGAGFVGTNLILKLLSLKAQIRTTIYKKPPQIKDQRVEFIKADLTKAANCHKVLKDIDYVFMCAANSSGAAVIEKNPLMHVTPNIIMNSLMLEAAYLRGIKKFLFISSSTVYPPVDYPVKETDVTGEVFDKYFAVGWMKRYSEILCQIYATKITNPMITVVVRPANVYGPYDDFEWKSSHVIPALTRKVVERHNPIEVWGDGNDIKDLIYVEDFVEGMLLAMAKLEHFDPINIGTGKSVTIRQILQYILKADNYHHAKIVFDKTKPTMIPKRLINVTKAKKLLRFQAKTPILTGIEKTIRWYRLNNK